MDVMQRGETPPNGDSVMNVKGLTERSLLRTSTRQIVTIFLLSALSYMLGVAWYEVVRALMDDYESRNTHLTKLELTYRYAAAVTIFVFVIAISIHHLMRIHVTVN